MGKGPKTPAPTAAEEANADVAREQWNEYVTQWHQPIMTWAKGVAQDPADKVGQATGITNADLAQQSKGMERAVGGSPVNPNSGRAVGAVSRAADLQAKTGAGAQVAARQGVEDARLQGMQQVANIGMGQKTEAVEGIGDIARQATGRAIADAWDTRQSRATTAGAVAGMAGVAAGIGMDTAGQKRLTEFADPQGGVYRQNANGVRVKPVY